MKFLILFISSLIIEIAATFYIGSVAKNDSMSMILWAFLGPFLSLPFIKYQIEAKNDSQRLRLALCMGLGYSIGSMIVSFLIK
jgi:hypothetical protein